MILVIVLRRFRGAIKHEGGNVAAIFALCLIPMIGIIGIGVDYSRGLAAKTTLDASADASALAAATEAMALLKQLAGQSNASSTAQQYGQYAGQQMFTTDTAKLTPQMTAAPSATVTVSPPANGVITATASYQVTMKNVFGPMFSVPTTQISGSASANLKMPTYTNISIAIDNSQSMGLAATSSGMTQLQGLTPDSCSFGCHVEAAAQEGSSNTTPYEQVAHNANPYIQLRIDVIKSATQTMISNAKSADSGLISFGLYTVQNGMTTAYSPPSQPPTSSDYTNMYNAAGSIDLDSATTSSGLGDTYFNGTSSTSGAIAKLASTIPASGDGSTYAKATQFLFIMTDGVEDEVAATAQNGSRSCATSSNANNPWAGPWGGHCTQAFDYTQCQTMLKANPGLTIGVIYTTYLSMPQMAQYQNLVQPFANQIAPNLQSCASPGWYYQASDATGIQTAMNALFQKATGSGVLTK